MDAAQELCAHIKDMSHRCTIKLPLIQLHTVFLYFHCISLLDHCLSVLYTSTYAIFVIMSH